MIDAKNIRDLILAQSFPANELGDLFRQFSPHQRPFWISNANVREDILIARCHNRVLGQIWQVHNQFGSFGDLGSVGFM